MHVSDAKHPKPLVSAAYDTWLKPSRDDSSTIPKAEMYFLKKGTVLNAISVSPLSKGHYLLTLDEALQGHTQWYVYHMHVLVEGLPQLASVNLNVPFHPQYDNVYQPNTSCFATSASMALAYYGVKPVGSLTLEDELYLYLSDNGLDRFSWQDIAYLIGKYGCHGEPNTGGTFTIIKAALDKGQPVILGTYFTHGGHIVLIKGYDQDGLVCHDPWGKAIGDGQYDFTPTGGDVHYSWDFIAQNASDVGGNDPTDLWIMPVRGGK